MKAGERSIINLHLAQLSISGLAVMAVAVADVLLKKAAGILLAIGGVLITWS